MESDEPKWYWSHLNVAGVAVQIKIQVDNVNLESYSIGGQELERFRYEGDFEEVKSERTKK